MLKWFRVRLALSFAGLQRDLCELTLCVDQVIRDLELLPEFGGQNWSAVFLQKFEGSVTIWPKSRCAYSHSSSIFPPPG